jgi:Zn ribbon nucleic-acid-binding protein
MATQTKSKTTLALVCPFCSNADEPITLNLLDIDEVSCSSCDVSGPAEKFAKKASENAAKWNAVVRGIDAMAEMVREVR